MSAPAPGIVLGDVEIIRVIEWSGPVRTARHQGVGGVSPRVRCPCGCLVALCAVPRAP